MAESIVGYNYGTHASFPLPLRYNRNQPVAFSQDRRFLSLISLKELESRLPSGKFIRVHKSFLLATQYITMIQHNMVHMACTTKIIAIGATYRDAFMARVKNRIIP